MGGKAFPNTESILLEEIDPTLQILSRTTKRVGMDLQYLLNNMLGSAGKKPVSGDIDINVDETLFNFDQIARLLIAAYGDENVMVRKGNNQIFTSIPIFNLVEGDGAPRMIVVPHPEEHRVQVDFMFGNHAWQAFSYFSPAPYVPERPGTFKIKIPGLSSKPKVTSRYKGLFRTELIKALTAYSSDWVLEEDGEMIARVGPTFFHDRGVVWRYRYRPFKKGSTTERIKAIKEVSKEEFMELFPSAFETTHTVMIKPKDVCKFLLPDASMQSFESYELLAAAIMHTHWGPETRKIHKIFLERLNSLKVDIPSEIKHGTHFGF